MGGGGKGAEAALVSSKRHFIQTQCCFLLFVVCSPWGSGFKCKKPLYWDVSRSYPKGKGAHLLSWLIYQAILKTYSPVL